MKQYYVYIMAKARNSTFYTGGTNDLIRRVYEHKNGLADGFTKKYGIKNLVYYEIHQDINEAIKREKLIKKWKREYKMNAIEEQNPDWRDLYFDLLGCQQDPAIRRGDNFVHGTVTPCLSRGLEEMQSISKDCLQQSYQMPQQVRHDNREVITNG